MDTVFQAGTISFLVFLGSEFLAYNLYEYEVCPTNESIQLKSEDTRMHGCLPMCLFMVV